MFSIFKKRQVSKPVSILPNYKSLIAKDVFFLSDFYDQTSYVKGMTSEEACVNMFNLSVSQTVKGNIVEIGSWQGRSTTFLAQSAKVSGNGKVYAIDHFKGNPGKEDFYRVDKEDLSDLKSNFVANMKKSEVNDFVELLDMSNVEAEKEILKNKLNIRLLFIDGCHDYEGVKKDFELFEKYVVSGGLIIFDDYSSSFLGVTRFVDELLERYDKIDFYYSYSNTFVLKIK
jgi:predicted O-methyltransferase YrrM